VADVFRLFRLMSGQSWPSKADAAVPLDVILKNGVRDQLTSPPSPASTPKASASWSGIITTTISQVRPPPVALSLAGLPVAQREAQARTFRIERRHSNGFTPGNASVRRSTRTQLNTTTRTGRPNSAPRSAGKSPR